MQFMMDLDWETEKKVGKKGKTIIYLSEENR